MAKIIFTEPDGVRREINAPIGITVMEAAVQHEVRGIVALCGGACACATCHVYVGQAWLAQVGPPEDMEQGMLEAAFEPRDNSRLSCQIQVSAELDGLEVTVPAQQGG